MIRSRLIALAAMLLFVAASLSAASFTSNGTGGGNWSSAATWGGAGVPDSGDNVTITGSDTVTVTDARSCNSVTLDTTSGNKTLDIGGTGALTVEATGNAILINAPTIGTNLVQLNGGALTLTNGDIQIVGGISTVGRLDFATGGGTFSAKQMLFTGTSSNAQVTFSSGAGSVFLSGNLGNGGSIVSGGSTFTFNGTAGQTINGYTFHNLTIAKTGTATLNGAIFVNGNLTISSGILDDGGNQITLNGGGTSNVNIGSTGVLKLGAGALTTSFPLNVNPSNVFFSPGSVVSYHSGLAQTINTSITYRRLFLSTLGGSVTHSFSGTLNVAEDLNITDNGPSTTTLAVGSGTLDVNTNIDGDGEISVATGNINIGGNWTSTVGLNAGSPSIVTYDGNGPQSVLAAVYHHLSITKTAGTATLAGNTTVGGDLGISGSGTLATNNNALTISGSFGNSATFDAGTSTVTFVGSLTNTGTVTANNATFRLNGAAAQVWSSVPLITLSGLEINNTAGVTIGNNTTVTGTMTLNGGNVTINGFFFIDVLATVNRTSGWFIGPLMMGFNPSPARRMHLGTSAAYLPIDIDSGSAGTLTARAVEGTHPNKTGTRVLARYWTIDGGSITPIDSITFNYNLGDVTSGTESEFMLGFYAGGSWTRKGDLVMEAVHTATLTNATGYVGDWVVGHAGSMGGAGKLTFTSINGGSSPIVNVPFYVDLETRTDDDSTTGDVLNASSVDVLLAAGTGSLLTANGTVNAGSHTVTVNGLSYDTAESGVQLTAAWASVGDPLGSGTSNTFTVVAPPSSLTVSSINDSGPGTLRDAIDTANAGGCGTPCTINFSTSGTIVLSSPLSPITRDDVTIDGYTAPGATLNTNTFGNADNANVTMQLDGSNSIATGFDIQGQNDVIKGFVIKNFISEGVKFSGTNTGSGVEGCFIGTDASGNAAAANGNGVVLSGSNGATIGGTSPAARNVISGNSSYGISSSASSTLINIFGNYIGVKASLSSSLANQTGIHIDSTSAADIGMLGGGNLISGNTINGIESDGSATVLANLIGTNGAGTAAIPNNVGIRIGPTGASNLIGPSELNVISGNFSHGLEILGNNNSVSNCYIGIGSDGTTSVPNGGNGIRLSGDAANNSIGVAAANKIASNTGRGVSVPTSGLGIRNVIRTNSIFSNGNLAIDLAEDGTTPNDTIDADTGANNLQNFPTISNAQIAGSNVQLTVSVDSSGASGTADFIIDVYKADSSSPEQALEYLGNSGCISGPTLSNYTFTVPAGTVVNGNKIVATATSYQTVIIGESRLAPHSGCATASDGTSELSAAATVTGAIHWINSSGGNWETASNWNPAQVPTSSDTVYIDAGGTYTVQINSNASAGTLHVGTGISGTQTLSIVGGTSLTLGSPSDVTTTGVVSLVGTLTGNGSLDVNGIFNWDNGTIAGSSALNINSGAFFNINNAVAHTLTQRLVTILAGGTANWNNGSMSMASGAHIDNYGTFDIKTDNSIFDNGFDNGIDNLGTFRKSVTAGTTFLTGVDFDHLGGTLDIQTGTFDVAGGTAVSPITISAGASLLINSDTFTLGTGASATGLGKIHITGGTLDVTGPAVSVEHLFLQGGTLGGTGTITGVSGNTWQWDGGTMSGTGSSVIPAGATLLVSGASTKTLSQRMLSIQNSGTLTFGGAGTFVMQSGGNVNNAGIFDIIGDASINDNGFAGAIVNSGTFKKTGTLGGTTSISNVTLNNSGTINIQTGTLDPADVSNNGTITIGGTLLVNSNTVTLGTGSVISGSGLTQVTAGTLTVNEAVTFPNLQLDNGTINGTAVFNVTSLTWNGGTMSGSGTTNIPASASATITTASAKNLQRSFNVAPTGTATFAGTGNLVMQAGGNITNNGLFEITGVGGFTDNGFAGTVANTGTFRKSTSSNTTVFSNINFNHSGGTLDVQTGTFDLAGGTSSAAIALASGTTLLVNSNTYTFAAGTTVSGAGLVSVAGGTLSVTGNVGIPQFQLSSGALDGGGTVTLTNTADWSGGTMQGGGTTTVDPSATLTITSASSKVLSNRTLTNTASGTITVSGNGPIILQSGGNISNAGLFHFTGDASVNDNGFAGAFANSGTLRKSTSANTTSFSNVALNHTGGTLDIQTGTFDPAGGTSSAAIALASSATLLFNSNTYTLANGTTFSGSGMVSLTAGTLSVTGNVSIPQFGMVNGTLDGAGTLNLTNVADWTSGTMQGGGATTVASGATLTLSSGSAKTLSARTLSSVGGGTIDITGTGTLFLQSGGNINNAGNFIASADSNIQDNGFAGGFANTGTFRKQTTTGATAFSNVAFSNNGGLVDLQTGTLSTSSFTQTGGSTLKVRLGGTAAADFSKLAVSSSPSLAGTLEVTLAGLYQPVGGDTFQILTSPGGAHSGDFTQPYTYPPLSAGRTFSDTYNGSGLLLTVSGFADLSIAKSAASNNYPVSSPIAYTLTVTNADPDMANSVSVSDTLDSGHTGISASGTGWNCNVVSTTVTCTATSPLPQGTAPSITINATTPSSPTSFINSATVSSTNDPNGANNTSTWPITIDPNTVDIDLSSVSPSSPVAQSTPFTFDFIIKNNGPQTATGLVFTAPIPAALTFNSAVPDQGPPCTFVASTVTCNLGTILSGNSPHVLLNLTTGTTPGTHYVNGSATQNEADSDLTNNTIPTPVQVIGATVVVTNTNDAGAGSLRQALLDAQNTSGCPAPCAITFNIGSGPFVIQPQNDLPTVAASAIVDGTSQPGYSGTPIIQVDGTLNPATYLLTLSGGGSTVKGLSLTSATKGIYINSNNNVVISNHIGITPAGANAGNVNGVVIDGSNNTIGGSGGANTIAYNTSNGVDVVTGIGNFIGGNFHDNAALGIDLGNDGATPNDANDADTGANNLQNFPTATGAFLNAGNLIVHYNLDSSGAANVGSVRVEIFEADSAVSGEGKTFLAGVCQTSDNFTASTSFAAGLVGASDPIVLTATGYSDGACATISDGTSEFSNVVLATNCTPPPATLNAPPTACANSTSNAASVNSPTATQFVWTVTGGTLVSGQGTANIIFSAPASGPINASVTVTDSNGCTNTQSANVNVTTPPAPVITGPTATCSGTPVTLDAGAGYASYLWSTTETTRFITVSPTATTTYNVTVTDGNSCSGSDSHTVTVNAPPPVNISGPTSTCASSPVTLDAGAGFASYLWSTTETTRFITVAPAATTTYNVTVTDANSCSASDSHTVNVTANPTATITAPTSVCASSTNNNASVPAGASSYIWTISNGFITAGQNTNAIIFTAGTSGTVTLGVTVTTGSCTSNGSANVPISGAPSATISAPSGVCASSAGNNASVPAGAASYVWTITNGTITAGQNTNAITFTAGASGTVSLGVTVGNGSCTNSGSANVPVTPPPAVNIIGPTTACDNGTFTLDAGAGFTTYQWSTGATTRMITVNQTAASATYSVIVTNAGGCSATDSHTVTLGGSPDANISVAANVDPSSTNNPASVPAQPGASYQWSIANGTITDGQGTNSILFTAGTSGNVDINVTVTLGGCIGNGAAGVIINGGSPAPTTDFAVVKQGPASVKPGDPIAWKIIVSNIGNSASLGQLVDTLPAGVTVNSVSGGSWNCNTTATQINCNGSLAPQTSNTIDIAATAPQQTGAVQNRVDVTASVFDVNTSNNSATASTNVVQVITCPANAPALLSPAPNALIQSSDLFSWSNVAGAALYELWITSNGTTTLAASTATTSANAQLASGPGSWFVVARGTDECDALTSETRNFTVQQTSDCGTHVAPQIITPAEGANVGPEVNVSWMPVPQAIGYRIWVEVDGTAAQDIGATNGAINLNVTLPPGAIALYVDALFAGCPSTRSNTVHFTVSDDPCAQRGTAALIAPANNAILGSSLVEFRWTPAANASAARVWFSRNGAPFEVAGETDGDTLSTYIQDGDVRWFVEELFDGCASTSSEERRFVIPADECELDAPALLSPANDAVLTSALAQIRWTAQADAVSYEVWMSFEGAVASLVETTTGTSFDYLLPEAGVYDVFVRALGDRCGSRDSQTRRFRYAPPVACEDGEQAILIAPLDGEHVTSAVTFSWGARDGVTRYELYTIRGNGDPQLAATTFDAEATVALANGRVKWFVRTYYGNCSPADSEERDLQVVGPPNACDDLNPPVISTPGEISSGIEFLLLWNEEPGATSYQLQLSTDSDFDDAQTITTEETSHALARINNGNAPLAVYARVRAIDGRCKPLPNVSAYSETAAIFILPRLGAIASVPLDDPTPVHYTINLGPELAGQTFTATPTEDWLTVSPSSGVVAPGGTNLDVTANPDGLGVGSHSGAISITLDAAASRLAAHGSTTSTTLNVNLVTPVTPAPANTPSPDTMIIPAVANADGINAHFQSDVRVANTSPKLIKYQLTFIPSGDAGITAGRQTTFSIEPGRTIALDDVLKSWFGTGSSNAVGVLQIKPLTSTSSSTSSASIGALANLVSFASSRTFNVTPNGTFGQYVPAVPFANFADKSAVLSLQQIAQSAKTRSNLGLVEGSGNPADVLIKVFGGNGQQLTSFTTRLNGGQHTQLNSFLFERGIQLEDGRVEVQVTSSTGKVTAYASVLDNETSDGVLVTPVALGSQGNTKWVLPGVADIRSGFADWQSDVRVFNAGTSSTNITASFYSQGGGDAKVQNITLAPGEVKQLDKVLPTLFGVTNDGGALHLATASASKIIATARTYNQTTKGTYGQFINGVTPQEAVAVGTRPLQLLQIEESPRMRSNVGVVEVTGKPVKLEVTVTPPDAKFAAVIEVDLAANEYRQMNSLLAGLGLGDTYNARVSIRAVSGQGRATAFASVIDLQTNDPMYVMPQ